MRDVKQKLCSIRAVESKYDACREYFHSFHKHSYALIRLDMELCDSCLINELMVMKQNCFDVNMIFLSYYTSAGTARGKLSQALL